MTSAESTTEPTSTSFWRRSTDSVEYETTTAPTGSATPGARTGSARSRTSSGAFSSAAVRARPRRVAIRSIWGRPRAAAR